MATRNVLIMNSKDVASIAPTGTISRRMTEQEFSEWIEQALISGLNGLMERRLELMPPDDAASGHLGMF